MYLQLMCLAITFVALSVFTGRYLSSARVINPRVSKQGRSSFLGILPMEFGYWLLTPFGRLAHALRVSPNSISWACLTVGAGSGLAAALGAIPLAGALVIVSASFDALDGMVARSRGLASDAGEVLDAAVDRYSEFCFLAGVCFYYRETAWAMVLAQAALLGSLLVSYSQAKAEALDVSVPGGWMRRPERAAYLGSGAFLSPLATPWLEPGNATPLHYLLVWALALVAVFANLTAIRRFRLLYRTLESRPAKTLKT